MSYFSMSYFRKLTPILSLVGLLCASALVTPAYAKCNSEARAEALKLRTLAASENDTNEAIFLLRTSAQICENYTTWIELGRLESARGAPDIAADYFSRAREMYQPDENGELSVGKLRRLGAANTLLASSLIQNDKYADALQALEAAKHYFSAYRDEQPDRVLQLQAQIDDGLSTASAPTLTRSLQLQRSGGTRGVGIRQKPQETSDDFVSEDATMLAEEQFDDLVAELPVVLASNTTTDPASSSMNDVSAESVTTGQSEAAATSGAIAQNGSGQSESAAPSQGATASSRLNIQVLFEFDSDRIDASGEAQVQKISDALNSLDLPDQTTVRIIGHTDINGDANYNLSLSERRAATVAGRISEQSDGLVLIPEGKGETDVRYPGTSAENHRRNRRVEIVID